MERRDSQWPVVAYTGLVAVHAYPHLAHDALSLCVSMLISWILYIVLYTSQNCNRKPHPHYVGLIGCSRRTPLGLYYLTFVFLSLFQPSLELSSHFSFHSSIDSSINRSIKQKWASQNKHLSLVTARTTRPRAAWSPSTTRGLSMIPSRQMTIARGSSMFSISHHLWLQLKSSR